MTAPGEAVQTALAKMGRLLKENMVLRSMCCWLPWLLLLVDGGPGQELQIPGPTSRAEATFGPATECHGAIT